MITILPCPNLEPDKRYRVIIDLTNNGLGMWFRHFGSIDEALAYIQTEMRTPVRM